MFFFSKIKKISNPIKNLLSLSNNLNLNEFQGYLSIIDEEANKQFSEIQDYMNLNNNNNSSIVLQIIDGTISSYFNNDIENLKYKFTHCNNLQNVELPNCLSLSEEHFNSCFSLQSISLPKCL